MHTIPITIWSYRKSFRSFYYAAEVRTWLWKNTSNNIRSSVEKKTKGPNVNDLTALLICKLLAMDVWKDLPEPVCMAWGPEMWLESVMATWA